MEVRDDRGVGLRVKNGRCKSKELKKWGEKKKNGTTPTMSEVKSNYAGWDFCQFFYSDCFTWFQYTPPVVDPSTITGGHKNWDVDFISCALGLICI